MTINSYKTCVTVGENTPDLMRKTLLKALKVSEYVEARLDFICAHNPNKNITKLLDALPKQELRKRIVCTIRTKQDGGKFTHTDKQRYDLLRIVAAYKPYRLDVELDHMQNDKKLAEDLIASKVSILASWHTFDHMPSTSVMHKKLQQMLKYTPHMKIACMAQNTTESIKMLEMYKWLANKKNIKHKKTSLISFAMGSAGQLTRILCIQLGSPYTYVSLGEAMAPGQLSLADLKSIKSTFY